MGGRVRRRSTISASKGVSFDRYGTGLLTGNCKPVNRLPLPLGSNGIRASFEGYSSRQSAVMGEIEKTSNAFDLYSRVTIRRSSASTYCVSLSGCPWPAGHRCADFCAQNQPRWRLAFGCFRPSTVSPLDSVTQRPFAWWAVTLADFTQHSSDGIVKKSGFSPAMAQDMNTLATIIKMSVTTGSSSDRTEPNLWQFRAFSCSRNYCLHALKASFVLPSLSIGVSRNQFCEQAKHYFAKEELRGWRVGLGARV